MLWIIYVFCGIIVVLLIAIVIALIKRLKAKLPLELTDKSKKET